MGEAEDWYETAPHVFRGEKVPFGFQIPEVQLYVFKTGVCVLAFRLYMEESDPYWIATAQYYLKKVSREKLHRRSVREETTFLDLATQLMRNAEQAGNYGFDFFYYANPGTERAHTFTYLEAPEKEVSGESVVERYKTELYFLRRCYHEGFSYRENPELDEEEIYQASGDTVWGISPEAAVCLVCSEMDDREFIEKRFFTNFNQQYLFMYVLLLHQKYVMYMFLTRLAPGIYKDINMLEDYKNQLYMFEADFVYSCITEVEQYQNLYDRMSRAFSIQKMYEDVHEPIQSLGEIRQEETEKKQKLRDDNMNQALFLLSILSIFSALVDSYDFAAEFWKNKVGSTATEVIQWGCIILIIGLAVKILINLLTAGKKKRSNLKSK
jgi:hypothetical protein